MHTIRAFFEPPTKMHTRAPCHIGCGYEGTVHPQENNQTDRMA